MKIIPRQRAPKLNLPLVGGGILESKNQPNRFSLLVFYRGLHCSICKHYLSQFESLFGEFAQRHTDPAAISMDQWAAAKEAKEDWGLKQLPVAHTLSQRQAEQWGLYLSRAIKPGEPGLFSEPGVFLLQADRTVHYVAIHSMPYARPEPQALLDMLDVVRESDYPPRGELGDAREAEYNAAQ